MIRSDHFDNDNVTLLHFKIQKLESQASDLAFHFGIYCKLCSPSKS
jgi:hypothetical protein